MKICLYFARLCCLVFPILLFCACSVGPKYIPPVSSVPTFWDKKNISSDVLGRKAWWRHFHDPLLTELIERNALNSIDLKIAEARVHEARTDYAIAYAHLFPKISADALPPNAMGDGLTQLLALSATLDLDLFGKQRQNRARAKANLQAQEAERGFTLLNLQTEIATSYIALREAQTKEKIVYRNLHANQQILHFSNSQYKSGLINYINIAQQKALIETQRAEVELNKAQIMALLHKLEILTGNNPDILAKKLLPYRPLPQIKQSITLGIPAEVLLRRPDILAAERRVAAAHANVRMAIANLFPQVSVGWLLGWQTETIASNLIKMQNSDNTFFGIMNAPLFNLSLHRIVDLRKREEAMAALQYQLVVMMALHEVKNQYTYCQHYKASATHFKRAVEQKKLVLKLANDVYKKGSSNFNTVFLAEEELNNLELSYLHNIAIYQIARINLYKALGGDV